MSRCLHVRFRSGGKFIFNLIVLDNNSSIQTIRTSKSEVGNEEKFFSVQLRIVARSPLTFVGVKSEMNTTENCEEFVIEFLWTTAISILNSYNFS